MTYHTVIDTRTGEIKAIGKDGQQYSGDEIEAAQRAAALGDPEAQAALDNLERTDFADVDPEALMRQMLHDCPECRAAMARGEKPTIVVPQRVESSIRRKVNAARNRWRSRKQRR